MGTDAAADAINAVCRVGSHGRTAIPEAHMEIGIISCERSTTKSIWPSNTIDPVCVTLDAEDVSLEARQSVNFSPAEILEAAKFRGFYFEASRKDPSFPSGHFRFTSEVCFRSMEPCNKATPRGPPVVAPPQHVTSEVVDGVVDLSQLQFWRGRIAPIRRWMQLEAGVGVPANAFEHLDPDWKDIEPCSYFLNAATPCVNNISSHTSLGKNITAASVILLRDSTARSGLLHGGIFMPAVRFAAQRERSDCVHSLTTEVSVEDKLDVGAVREIIWFAAYDASHVSGALFTDP